MARPDDHPNYNVHFVEAALLEVATMLHPERLTPRELSLRVVGDPEDGREVQVTATAMCGLHKFDLLRVHDDGTVGPTPAAVRAFALLG